jgi:hypothetical protein
MSAHQLTTQNVSSLTTYELRQELVRRNKLDIPENQINHRSMLQRLIVELVAEEDNKVAETTAKAVETTKSQMEAAKALREQKKQEAIERSRQRQAENPAYFQHRKELNEIKKTEKIEEIANDDSKEVDVVDNDTETATADDDPFRTTSKHRSKIFVK